ncbi:MAG: hypothetical protein AABX61_01455 [Nanoarchaeota archaeon]
MTSIKLDEIVLIKGKGFVRRSDNQPVNITDGDKFVTYGSIMGDFEQMVRADIFQRPSEMPKGINGFTIHGGIPLDRTSKNTDVQIDYYAFVYTPR